MNAQISVSLPVEILADIKKNSEKKNISISKFVQQIIQEYYREKEKNMWKQMDINKIWQSLTKSDKVFDCLFIYYIEG